MDKNLDKELGQVLSRVFLLQSHLSKFARGTWTRNLDNCRLPCYKLSQYYAPIPGRPRFHNFVAQGGNPNLDKNLDKELGQVLTRVFLLQSHLSKFVRGTWTRNLDNCGLPCYKLSQYYAPTPGRPLHNLAQGGNPNLDKNLDKELGQMQSHLSKFARGTWTRNLDNCGLPCYKLSQYYAAGPDSTTSWPRAETRTWTRTWTRNLDKFYHVFSSRRATCPSSPGELGQGTWTTAGYRCNKAFSLEGVSQMDSILPDRLLAL